MSNLWGIIISYVYIAIIIVCAKFFEKYGKEASRKFIHIMLGNWWFIAMLFFSNVIWAAFVPATFVVINYISYKKQLISVMERDDNEKEGLGTVYFAVTLLILSIVTFGILKKPELGLAPVLIMAYGDGFAAIFGQKIKSKEIKIGNTKKTIAGSATMFIISFIILAVYLIFTETAMWPIYALIMSLVVTIVELVSIKGLDNITVPMSIFIMLALI